MQDETCYDEPLIVEEAPVEAIPVEDMYMEEDLASPDQEEDQAEPKRCYVTYTLDGKRQYACGGAGYPFSMVAATLPDGAKDAREMTEEEVAEVFGEE